MEIITWMILRNLTAYEHIYLRNFWRWISFRGFDWVSWTLIGSDFNTRWSPRLKISVDACHGWIIWSAIVFMPVFVFPFLSIPTFFIKSSWLNTTLNLQLLGIPALINLAIFDVLNGTTETNFWLSKHWRCFIRSSNWRLFFFHLMLMMIFELARLL
jgi:hypothetical protein